MDIITQIKKEIDGVEFSKRAKEKIDGILAKAEIRKMAGKNPQEWFDKEDKKMLEEIIREDIILDVMEIKIHRAFLGEVDKLLAEIKS